LRKRLHVEEYEGETPYVATDHRPESVRIKMRQHAGQPASPVVKEGERVAKGQVVGRVDASKLGVDIHASIAGKVRAVTPDYVEVVA